MKKTFFLSIMLMLGISAFAQKAEIAFETKSYDFGEVKEENGPVSTFFEFKNTGQLPLVLNSVTASCGCTTPSWPKEPIKPGDTGSIKVTYNVVGRPGPFRKTITVKSNSSEGTTQLTISGSVKPKPKSVEEEYPVLMGDIRLKSQIAPKIEVFKGESRTEKIQFKNISDKDVKLTFIGAPKHIAIESNPAVVKAGETGNILITFNSKSIEDYGDRVDYAYIQNGISKKMGEENKITISSNIREDFRNYTSEQKEKSPIVEPELRLVKVEIPADSKRTVTFELKNTGKSNLIVHKMIADKAGIAKATCSKKTIAPGQSAVVKIDITTEGIKYDTYSKVTFITNSYRTPTLVIPVNIKITK
ncbi:MAG: DUF1573 domain-containing protein [Bacteroidales bacterium]|jgi:hypothetical protein|nr:DUF1573 domain-containing protein [Bacteroidales bacterium]MBP5135448.1 DUF1573 domain-containing protein [Paludibacteraceae bacterium]MBR6310269.1 DUF1573 domain-containing protein [Paludibacteraceae bacterium]MDD6357090.1 DUF1573 domain-containing protein [Bacteroidales bacterium]